MTSVALASSASHGVVFSARSDGAKPQMKQLTSLWWTGRVKELEGCYQQATECYERVCEKEPTIGRVSRLASCYLAAKHPDKAAQLLSKFLENVGSTSMSGNSQDGTAETRETNVERKGATDGLRFSTKPTQAELSTARMLHGRSLFATGKDDRCAAMFKSALEGGDQEARVLYEWSLSEAILARMRSSSQSSVEDSQGGAANQPFARVCVPARDSALGGGSRLHSVGNGVEVEAPAPVSIAVGATESPAPSSNGIVASSNQGQHATQLQSGQKMCAIPLPDGDSDCATASSTSLRAAPPSSCEEKHMAGSECTESSGSIGKGVDSEYQQGSQRRHSGPRVEDGGDELLKGQDSQTTAVTSRARCPRLESRGLDRALELATRCLRADGFHTKAYALRAELEARRGRKDRAIADLKAAASLDSGNSWTRINLGVMYLYVSRPDLATVEFDTVERASKGSAERIIAAYNLGVAAATAGDLSRAEAAFTRALAGLATESLCQNRKVDVTEPVTPGACLANRALVRFAMKYFEGAVQDLGGTTASGDDVGNDTAFAAGGGVISGGMGEEALENSDCLLGRALAEGRLGNKASREAAGHRLRTLLRSTRFLTCEAVAARVGCGNLAATHGETTTEPRVEDACKLQTREDSAEVVEPGSRHVEGRSPGEALVIEGGCRALRQFLHAIHVCPTASAAWLNAAEVLNTAAEQHETDAGSNDSDPSDGTPRLVSARVASLALLDAVLSMAPTHPAALRCQATTLAGLGRPLEALVSADAAVFAAEEGLRVVQEERLLGNSLPAKEGSTATPCPQTTRGGSDTTVPAIPAFEKEAKEEPVGKVVPATGRGCLGERFCSASIGFMQSSKITVVAGGLLVTGGGRPGILDVAKGLVVRGCLSQKVGRRKRAEEDYRRALEICHGHMEHLDHGWNNNNAEPADHDDNDARNAGHAEHRCEGSAAGNQQSFGRRRGSHPRGKASWSRRGRRRYLEVDSVDDTTGNWAPKERLSEHPPHQRESQSHDRGTGTHAIKVPPGFRGRPRPDYTAALTLEGLIHHNLATLHMVAVIDADTRASFHKMAVVREASEFTACGERAAADGRPGWRTHWWHSTVLAVARIVSTIDSLGGGSCRGTAIRETARDVWSLLNSAETVAMLSGGRGGVQGGPEAWSLAGAARSHALTTIRVNLAAVEKIGAMSASQRRERRREGLERAIGCMSDAIASCGLCPELFIERGGLFARIDADNVAGGSSGHGEAAASDFATALWLEGHLPRRYQPGVGTPSSTTEELPPEVQRLDGVVALPGLATT